MEDMSEKTDAIVGALAKAQAKLQAIKRNKEVTVTPKSGRGSYKFSYATLDAIIEHVRGVLTENGLWFTQTTAPVYGADNAIAPGLVLLRTTLHHESGQWIASEMLVPDQTTNQEFGSALTYRRRYALATLLGIAADSDDDGNISDGNEIEDDPTPHPPPHAADPHAVGSILRQQPPKDKDKAAEAAQSFGTDAVLKLRAFKTVAEFKEWYMGEHTLAKIARLKAYNPSLHTVIVKLVGEWEEKAVAEERAQ